MSFKNAYDYLINFQQKEKLQPNLKVSNLITQTKNSEYDSKVSGDSRSNSASKSASRISAQSRVNIQVPLQEQLNIAQSKINLKTEEANRIIPNTSISGKPQKHQIFVKQDSLKQIVFKNTLCNNNLQEKVMNTSQRQQEFDSTQQQTIRNKLIKDEPLGLTQRLFCPLDDDKVMTVNIGDNPFDLEASNHSQLYNYSNVESRYKQKCEVRIQMSVPLTDDLLKHLQLLGEVEVFQN